MTSKEIEVVDSTNKQYNALVKMQMKSYKEVLKFCKESINDLGKIQIIDQQISAIDKRIVTELEELKIDNGKFIEHCKQCYL